MKKYLYFLLFASFFVVVEVLYFSQFVYSENSKEIITPVNIADRLLDEIDIEIEDLNLTEDEIRVIEKYQEVGNFLNVVDYDWPSKGEWINYNGRNYRVGFNDLTIKIFEKVFHLNILKHKLPLKVAEKRVYNGQLDLIVNVSFNSERASKAYISKENIFYDNYYVYTLKKKFTEKSYSSKEITVGFVKDDPYFSFENMGNSMAHGMHVNYVVFDNYEEGYKMLENGKINSIVSTIQPFLIEKGCQISDITNLFSSKSGNIMFSKHNEDFIFLQSAIVKLYQHDNFMSTVAKKFQYSYNIMQFHLGNFFGEEENDFIKSTKNNPVSIKALTDISPYIYYDHSKNKWSGSSFEIWDQFSFVSGLNYKIIPDKLLTIDGKISDVILNNSLYKIDGVIGVGITSNRVPNILFTQAPFKENMVFVGKVNSSYIYNFNDIQLYEIGTIKNYATTDFLEGTFPHTKFEKKYKSHQELLEALNKGDIDYFLVTENQFRHLYYNLKNYNLAIKANFPHELKISNGFNKNDRNEIIVQIFNKVLPFINVEQIKSQYHNISVDIGSIMSRSKQNIIFFFLQLLTIVMYYSYLMIKKNKKLKKLLYVDKSTGVCNIDAFKRDFVSGKGIGFIIKINDYQQVRDMYGNTHSNLLMKKLSKIIDLEVEKYGGVIYKMSGSRFIVYNSNWVSTGIVKELADKILVRLRSNMQVKLVNHKLDASIAILKVNKCYSHAKYMEMLNMSLGMALKQKNKKSYIAEHALVKEYKKRFLLQNYTTVQFYKRKFMPYYQPTINLITGEIIGVEVFSKWHIDDVDIVNAKDFITTLELNKTIAKLDISIIKRACEDFSGWRESGTISNDFTLCINLSSVTIRTINIIKVFKNILKKYNIPYNRIEVEVNGIGSDIKDILLELSKLGMKICADYNSFEKVDLPFDTIRVDKTIFDSPCSINGKIIKNIISYSKKNNVNIVAVGAETEKHIKYLSEIGIENIQGYYYYKPLNNYNFKDLMRKSSLKKRLVMDNNI